MKTFASLFSGGGLADIGAVQAGLKPLWGIELEAGIAEWYARNLGDHIIVSPVQNVDYSSLEVPHWLHMSPPCTRASNANTQAGECELDIELAQACIDAINELLPPVISLENVLGYRKFESFALICNVLEENGYTFKWWCLNSANYSVPQTRKRLFLVASRTQRIHKPEQTHEKKKASAVEQLSLFPPLLPWNGWYAAIEDLIPELPEDEFAPWQLERLPAELETLLVMTGNSNIKDARPGKGCLSPLQPAATVTAGLTGGLPRVLLVVSGGQALPRNNNEPSQVILVGQVPKAYLVNDNSRASTSPASHPAMTVVSSRDGLRAFIVDGQTNDSGQSVTIRHDESPAFVVSASQDKRPTRAYAGGRVVRMTPRCLARFQSVPDSYMLPEKASLACHIIGNGVPSLMMQRLIEANL